MASMMRTTVDGKGWRGESPQRSAGRRTWAATAWLVAGTIAVAVTSYTLSLQVASERRDVERLARQNGALQSDLKALDAELRVRMRMPQLQRWNDSVLGLVPISATQYLARPVQLAAYGDAPETPALPRVQLAVRDLPADAAPAAVRPLLVRAQAPAVAPVLRQAPQVVMVSQVVTAPPTLRPAAIPRPQPEAAPADLLQQVEMSFGAQSAPQP
jgi:hypothetical protein